jgi:hypothetical protein
MKYFMKYFKAANVQNEQVIGQQRRRVAEAGAELTKGQQARANLEQEARVVDRTFNVQSNYTFF